MMNNNKGSALLIPVAVIGVLGYVGVTTLKGNSNFLSAFSKESNKFSAESFNSLIASSTKYESSCKDSWMSTIDVSAGVNQLVSLKSGSMELNLPGNIKAKNNSVIEDYGITIKSLSLDNLTKVQSLYGFDFYVGEVYIQSNLNKKSIKGNTVSSKNKVTDLAVLTDKLGKVVACGSSITTLQDNLDFVSAKKIELEAIAKNPQQDARAVQDLLDLLSEQTGRTVTASDLPPSDSLPAPTASCNSTCQMVQGFFTRNSAWYEEPGKTFDPAAAASNVIDYAHTKNLDIDKYAVSYNSLSQVINHNDGTYNNNQGVDLYIKNNINENNFNDFISVQDNYVQAVNNQQWGSAVLIEAALNEGATVTQIAQNIDSITSKYSDDQISAWFSAGYTLHDAYAQGYLP